jgi:predicted MPP superfamily phosphohydrolase
MMGLLPIVVAAVLAGFFSTTSPLGNDLLASAVWTYLSICGVICILAAILRLRWRHHPERKGALLTNHTVRIRRPDSHETLAAPGIPAWLVSLPGNEALTISVQEKEIAIPRLAALREPLRIAHISDLHMSGRLTRAYFERVVDETNALDADLIAITGDIVEREKCIDWIPATLAKLRAPGGVYFVLGNHDLHVSEDRLKAALSQAGLTHLGGVCHDAMVRGTPLVLGGNELPWYKPVSSFAQTPRHNAAGLPLRIVLAHSPDQFAWAQSNEVDLVLAGHLHGGQVRLPILGAILAPSRHGVRYSAGVFTVGDTVMHVSRGTGSLTPLRYNCAPEIALLKLFARKSQ